MGRFRARIGRSCVDLEQRLDGSAFAVGGAVAPTGMESSFRVLSDVARLLVSESDLDTMLEAVAEGLNGLVPHDTITIYEADVPRRRLRPVYVRDEEDAEQIFLDNDLPFGEGITGYAAEHEEAQFVNDADMDGRALQIPGTGEDEESM